MAQPGRSSSGGSLHALYQTFDLLKRKWLPATKSSLGRSIVQCAIVNVGVVFAWIFFRAHSFVELKRYLGVLFTFRSGGALELFGGLGPVVFVCCLASIALLGLSYLTPRDCRFATLRGHFLFVAACSAAIVFMGVPPGGEFIYFQF